jgi:hypothetical protein
MNQENEDNSQAAHAVKRGQVSELFGREAGSTGVSAGGSNAISFVIDFPLEQEWRMLIQYYDGS